MIRRLLPLIGALVVFAACGETATTRTSTPAATPSAQPATAAMTAGVATASAATVVVPDVTSALATAAPTLPPAPSATPIPTPAQTGETGIAGMVSVGPTCPVERPDSPCPDRPLEARITVWRGTVMVAETRSGGDGRFKIAIAPGSYRVVGETDGTFPRGSEQEVTVTAGALTIIEIRYESGIR